MTTTIYPNFACAIELGTNNPYQEMFSKIGTVYADSMRANAEQLWFSSARIIQEHTLRAFVAASQSCIEALAKNTAAVQQQSFGRIVGANQKAAEIMGQGFTNAMLASMKPAR
jgi:hypothetical protein